jgi:hypothetical protein
MYKRYRVEEASDIGIKFTPEYDFARLYYTSNNLNTQIGVFYITLELQLS